MPIQTASQALENQSIGSPFALKNRFINGDMRIAQRSAGASFANIVGAVYPIDRWGGYCSQASKFTIQQNAGSVALPEGFTNYLGFTSSSSYSPVSSDEFQVSQNIEGYYIADLGWGTVNAKPITISFWVMGSITGTYAVSLSNTLSARSYPATYTITAANTWEYKTITIRGDTTGTWLTNNGLGISVRFVMGYGSNFVGTANTWNAGNFLAPTGTVNLINNNGATWRITGVQLEKGSTATSFEHRHFPTELALCQRYFEKSVSIETAPTLANFTGIINFPNGSTVSDGYSRYTTIFKVTKRATPTVVAYTSTGTGKMIYFRDNGSATDGATGGLVSLDSCFYVVGNYLGSGSVLDVRTVFFDYYADSEI
jgi:hypothetical protein